MSKAMKKAAKELRKHLKRWRSNNPNPSWANRQEVYKTPSSWSTIDKFAEFKPSDLTTFDPSKLTPEEASFLRTHEAMSAVMARIPVKKLKPAIKRFILFYGAEYYPSGGWSDFMGSFDTLEEALSDEIPSGNNWWHVIDITTGEQVADNLYGKRGSGTRLIDNEKINHNERKPL